MTPLTVVVFALVMGSLWLATVPLTAGLVGHIYGLRYMGTLYGIVFFSHQLGSFMGISLSGWMYDLYGTYDAVWWVGVAHRRAERGGPPSDPRKASGHARRAGGLRLSRSAPRRGCSARTSGPDARRRHS